MKKIQMSKILSKVQDANLKILAHSKKINMNNNMKRKAS